MKKKLMIALGALATLAHFNASATVCQDKVTGMGVIQAYGIYEVELNHGKYEYYNLGTSRTDFDTALDAYKNGKTLKLTFSTNESCATIRSQSYMPDTVEIYTSTGGGGGGGGGGDCPFRDGKSDNPENVKAEGESIINCDIY
ncbi:hypothetical protein KIH87_17160 [Paraneptunicella aestuarii]|uniref:hypothetical protein n=1 Tax=Paraneptunicella aestuarii TaxID=2831148 RepID=UPI001E42CB48|nr:hypothetical protein [Paraneptunicella aestuarii]UAA38392.1 hypothetical protein KIH87_17160 [Paraneptunicella aestuarii]